MHIGKTFGFLLIVIGSAVLAHVAFEGMRWAYTDYTMFASQVHSGAAFFIGWFVVAIGALVFTFPGFSK